MVEQDVKPAVETAAKAETPKRSMIAVERAPMYKPEDVQKRGVTGTVGWFDLKRGFGAIKLSDEDADPDAKAKRDNEAFVHSSTIAKCNPAHLVASLHRGEAVKFDIVDTDKGKLAVNVTSAGGGHVEGHEKAPKEGDLLLPMWQLSLVSAAKQPTRHYGRVRNEDGEWTAKWTNADIKQKGVDGRVTWFTVHKGFGEIADAQDNKYFVHFSSVLKPNAEHAVESVGPGEEVRFDVIEVVVPDADGAEKTKLEAVNVTACDGGAVRGHALAPKVFGHKRIPDAYVRHMGYPKSKKINRKRVDNKKVDEHKKEGGGRPKRRERKTTQRSENGAEQEGDKPKRRTRRDTKPKHDADEGTEHSARDVKHKAETRDMKPKVEA